MWRPQAQLPILRTPRKKTAGALPQNPLLGSSSFALVLKLVYGEGTTLKNAGWARPVTRIISQVKLWAHLPRCANVAPSGIKK